MAKTDDSKWKQLPVLRRSWLAALIKAIKIAKEENRGR